MKKVIGMGLLHDGLYILENCLIHLAAMSTATQAFDLWHWRLGHPTYSLDNTFSVTNLFILK